MQVFFLTRILTRRSLILKFFFYSLKPFVIKKFSWWFLLILMFLPLCDSDVNLASKILLAHRMQVLFFANNFFSIRICYLRFWHYICHQFLPSSELILLTYRQLKSKMYYRMQVYGPQNVGQISHWYINITWLKLSIFTAKVSRHTFLILKKSK